MCDSCTAIATEPTNTVPGWDLVAHDDLGAPELVGRTVRLFRQATGVDGDDAHLVAVIEGEFVELVEVDDQKGLALVPDPDAPILDEHTRRHAAEIVAQRQAAIAAGGQPNRDLWGPLGDRTLVYVATERAEATSGA